MTKRQTLNYNSDELALHLKQSTGQGVDALFSSPSPAPPGAPVEQRREEEKDNNTQAPKRARMHARQQPSRRTSFEQELREQVLIKRHLSSFTFRFQLEELEALDRVTDEINQNGRHKTSKNDVIRLALNWLLKEYEVKKEDSMLTKVLNRI
jgi:hypothetical protein